MNDMKVVYISSPEQVCTIYGESNIDEVLLIHFFFFFFFIVEFTSQSNLEYAPVVLH